MNTRKKQYGLGLLLGAGAFTLWGLLPLYWKLVQALTPWQVFAQRVVWSFVFVLVLLKLKGGLAHFFSLIKQPSLWLKMLGPAIFVSINWMTYIYAVTQGYVIEASLGYYINPLVLTLLGLVFLKERLTKLQAVGMLLALIGVAIRTLAYGQVPYIALILAISFAIYGLLKKLSALAPLDGLSFETLIVGAPALLFLFNQEFSGHGISGNLPPYFWLLIAVSGIATATPLLMYAESAKRLPLNALGFLQYISPTISLVLGIFVFKETFNQTAFIAFAFIWSGLVCFSISQYRALNSMK